MTLPAPDILNLLERGELLLLADRFKVMVRDRRKKESIIEELSASDTVHVGKMLVSLPRARLKELCLMRGLDDSGRENSAIVERLLEDESIAAPTEAGSSFPQDELDTAFELPFPESTEMIEIRSTTSRLADSSLPLLLTGEPGTGRRVLAHAIAERRAKMMSTRVRIVPGHLGVPADIRTRGLPFVLFVQHLPILPVTDQLWIADALKGRGLFLSATAEPPCSTSGGIVPALNALLDPGTILLPPLRDRPEDLLRWATFFVERARGSADATPEIDSYAERVIRSFHWPGNLSQLEMCLQRASLISRGTEIRGDELGVALDKDSSSLVPLHQAVEDFRRRYVLSALARFGGNRSKTAQALGVDTRTMFRYLEKWGDA